MEHPQEDQSLLVELKGVGDPVGDELVALREQLPRFVLEDSGSGRGGSGGFVDAEDLPIELVLLDKELGRLRAGEPAPRSIRSTKRR